MPPIGILRVHFKKAIDVKNVEGALGGKSDPYVRVLNAGNTMGRTEVVNNNLNPEWDAFVYVPVHSMSERPIFEVSSSSTLEALPLLIPLALGSSIHRSWTIVRRRLTSHLGRCCLSLLTPPALDLSFCRKSDQGPLSRHGRV